MCYRSITAAIVALASFTGCGGGSTASAPTVPAAPTSLAPSVTLTLSENKITLGSSMTISWSTANATLCTASGAWSGTQALSGTSVQKPLLPGPLTYTLTCEGAGGSGKQSAVLVVPIPVLKSSFENKVAAGEAIGSQKLPPEVVSGNAIAFADFFQDGTYSMVTHSLEYNVQDSSTANKFGHIHFWQKVNGTWIDHTSTLLTDSAGCLHPRKAIIADFNGSGRPSIFFACHGFDAPPWRGEAPHILLSQADGTYKNIQIPLTGFFHGASAADVNGDGFPDVLMTDNVVQQQPFFLINNKDGTFTQDVLRLPPSTKYQAIFTAELIDFDHTGKYDVFFGGHEQQTSGNWSATILYNDGAGAFIGSKTTQLPALPGYGFPTDIVYSGGAIYLARTIDLPSNFYRGAAIQKITYPTIASQMLYQANKDSLLGTRWINWIITNNGNIVTMDSAYGISVSR